MTISRVLGAAALVAWCCTAAHAEPRFGNDTEGAETMTAVFSGTSDDYIRTKLPDGSFQGEPYGFGRGGYYGSPSYGYYGYDDTNWPYDDYASGQYYPGYYAGNTSGYSYAAPSYYGGPPAPATNYSTGYAPTGY